VNRRIARSAFVVPWDHHSHNVGSPVRGDHSYKQECQACAASATAIASLFESITKSASETTHILDTGKVRVQMLALTLQLMTSSSSSAQAAIGRHLHPAPCKRLPLLHGHQFVSNPPGQRLLMYACRRVSPLGNRILR